jgi:hypothetical protein
MVVLDEEDVLDELVVGRVVEVVLVDVLDELVVGAVVDVELVDVLVDDVEVLVELVLVDDVLDELVEDDVEELVELELVDVDVLEVGGADEDVLDDEVVEPPVPWVILATQPSAGPPPYAGWNGDWVRRSPWVLDAPRYSAPEASRAMAPMSTRLSSSVPASR